MFRTSTFCAVCIAATLLVAAIGMASAAIDYSTAMNPNGELGFKKPIGVHLGVGSFDIPDIGSSISNAVSTENDGNSFVVSNFRNVPAGAMENLAGIEPVSEPTGG